MSDPRSDRRRGWRNAFIGLWLTIQVVLPLRGLLADGHDTRGRFSWNMYARHYSCSVEYRVYAADGQDWRVKHKNAFLRRARAGMVLYRNSLPRFHEFLCDHFREDLGEIRGEVRCSLNFGPKVALVDPEVDVCTSPDHGVQGSR